jgi:hypothetical protein
MITTTPSGFQVTSDGGKALSKPNQTLEAAKKRLRQVELFKHKARKTAKRKG